MVENKSSYHVSFVILHYIDTDTTESCINSILQNIEYDNYSIIVVDNGSPNQSGIILQEEYASEKKIEVIISEENLGYAKGNNIGYKAAKERYQADFIVVANNDVLFQNSDFIDKIIEIYNRTGCYLLGPDIVTPDGMHQNPFRTHSLTYSDVKKKLRNRKIFKSYLKFKRALHIEDKIHLLEGMFDEKNDKMSIEKTWDNEQFDVVLHGSCIIYTLLYIQNEEEAFLPITFMYGEEDLLANKCQKKDYKTLYSPKINVLHLGGITTNIFRNTSESIYFRNENTIKGLENLMLEMNELNEGNKYCFKRTSY